MPVTLISRSEASGGLTHAEAQESPCLSCAESPCCTYLPVHRFSIEHLTDLDYARYLLNFAGIELGIDGAGEWSVYYHKSCRHLSPDDGSCGLHGLPEKPLVCQSYSPYRCWYKRVMTVPAADDFVRVDHRRLDWYLDLVRYDENRRITSKPSWESVVAAFVAMPIESTPVPGPVDDVEDAPRAKKTIPVRAVSSEPRRYSDVAATTPCETCSSFCCTRVEFPLEVPGSVSSLDFVRFSVGFPGVEVGITDEGWRLIVNTTCRHLDGTSCSIFGTPDRPIRCSYLDAWRCSFKADYEPTSQRAIVRVDSDQYRTLLELVRIDDDGQVIEMPTVDEMRAHLASQGRTDIAEPEPAEEAANGTGGHRYLEPADCLTSSIS